MTLYDRLLAGEPAARDEMITRHYDMIERRVDKFLAKRPQMARYRDELLSDGSLALVEAVDGMRAKPPREEPNERAYLSKAIDDALRSFHDATIPVPARSKRRGKQAPKREQLPDVAETERPNLLKAVVDACLDPRDDQLIELMREGYTFKEIGGSTGVTPSAISKRFAAIKRRCQND